VADEGRGPSPEHSILDCNGTCVRHGGFDPTWEPGRSLSPDALPDDECVPDCPRRIEDTDDGHWRCAECGAQCLCHPTAPARERA
jgi:hypothetical protein